MREVVKTVRISDTTIRKRLGDFRDTPSSQLTIDEFQTIDLEEEQDPPSFTQARKRAKQQLEELNKPEIASELEKFQTSIEKILGIDSKKDKPVPVDESGNTNDSSRTLEKDDTRDASSNASLVVPPLRITDLMLKIDDVEGIWNCTQMVIGFNFQSHLEPQHIVVLKIYSLIGTVLFSGRIMIKIKCTEKMVYF